MTFPTVKSQKRLSPSFFFMIVLLFNIFSSNLVLINKTNRFLNEIGILLGVVNFI